MGAGHAPIIPGSSIDFDPPELRARVTIPFQHGGKHRQHTFTFRRNYAGGDGRLGSCSTMISVTVASLGSPVGLFNAPFGVLVLFRFLGFPHAPTFVATAAIIISCLTAFFAAAIPPPLPLAPHCNWG